MSVRSWMEGYVGADGTTVVALIAGCIIGIVVAAGLHRLLTNTEQDSTP